MQWINETVASVWTTVTGFAPAVDTIATSLTSHGWIWLYVMAIGFFSLVNEWAHSPQVARWVTLGSEWFVVVAFGTWVVEYLKLGTFNASANWGAHWLWPVVLVVGHKHIARWVSKLLPPASAKASAPAKSPAAHH